MNQHYFSRDREIIQGADGIALLLHEGLTPEQVHVYAFVVSFASDILEACVRSASYVSCKRGTARICCCGPVLHIFVYETLCYSRQQKCVAFHTNVESQTNCTRMNANVKKRLDIQLTC